MRMSLSGWCGMGLVVLVVCGCRKEEPVVPTVTAVAPGSGLEAGGESLTITGTGFVDVMDVRIGNGAGQAVRTNSDTSLTVVAPPGSRDTVAVSVTTPGGTATLPMAYRYLAAVSVTRLEPQMVVAGAPAQVVLRGTGLWAPVTVTLTGPGGPFTVTAGTGTDLAVPVMLPALQVGSYTVGVKNGDELETTVGAPLTVTAQAAPTLTAVEPTRGLERGGNPVRMAGTGLLGATAVRFGAVNAPGFQVNSNGTEVVVDAPMGTRGRVAVSVETPNGTATLPDAYTYTRAVVISQVTPPQLAANTAGSVTLTGTGFVAPARVTLSGPATVVLNVTQATETALTAQVPPLAGGDYLVTVVNLDGESGVAATALRLRGGLVVESIFPRGGFVDEDTPVEITGPDLSDVTEVLVGSARCTSLVQKTTQRVGCTAPRASQAGAVDVVVRRGTVAEGVLTGGFTYAPAQGGALTVLGVLPGDGNAAGGTVVEVLVAGLPAVGPTVRLGGTLAPVTNVTAGRRIQVTAPQFTLAGGALSQRVDVQVSTGSGMNTAPGAFRYYAQPVITAVTPNKGATVGGDLVTVTGSGFTAQGTRVLLDGQPCTGLTVQSPTQVQCRAASHTAGLVDAVAYNEFAQGPTVTGAFEYVEAVRIVTLTPPTVSTAGDAYVEAVGSGLVANRMALSIVEDGTVVGDVTVLSDTRLIMRVPARATAGTVTLRVEDTARLGQPFASGEIPLEYVDPTIVGGGVGGGAISRNINITTLRADTGARVPGAAVWVGNAWATSPTRKVTNAAGMAVLSTTTLQGPVTVSAVAAGYGGMTYVDVDAGNVTLVLEPFQPAPPVAPTYASLSGTVSGWDFAGYPQGAAPGRIKRVAVVVPSEPGVGQPLANPGSGLVVAETGCDVTPDGVNNPLGTTFNVNAAVGRHVALLAVVFFYDSKDGTCAPDGPEGEGFLPITAAAMGILPDVVVAPGTNPGLNLAINVAATRDASALLMGAPAVPSGTTAFTVDALLDLGLAGTFTFYTSLFSTGNVSLGAATPAALFSALPAGLTTLSTLPTGLPATGGFPPFVYRAVAALSDPLEPGGLGVPSSEVYRRGAYRQQETVSGFYNFPGMLLPANGANWVNRTLQWGALNRTDGVAVVEVARVVTVGPQGPVLEPTWKLLLAGDHTQVSVPDPTGSGVLAGPLPTLDHVWQLQALTVASGEAFSFHSHTLGQLEPAHLEARLVTDPLLFVP